MVSNSIMNDCLLDDYIMFYLESNNKKYLSKAILKLIKCGFDEKVATEIINTEIEIIKFRDEISNPIIKQYFWLDKVDLFIKHKEGRVFEKDVNNYTMIRNDNKCMISNYTLTLSELCLIFDEAYFVSRKLMGRVPENMFKECYDISKKETMDSWVIKEFKLRIEDIYRNINKVESETKLLASKQIDNLYKEELNILLSQRPFNCMMI